MSADFLTNGFAYRLFHAQLLANKHIDESLLHSRDKTCHFRVHFGGQGRRGSLLMRIGGTSPSLATITQAAVSFPSVGCTSLRLAALTCTAIQFAQPIPINHIHKHGKVLEIRRSLQQRVGRTLTKQRIDLVEKIRLVAAHRGTAKSCVSTG